jgi:UDPglucose--hexose-1-phosphate uridylyltransferase
LIPDRTVAGTVRIGPAEVASSTRGTTRTRRMLIVGDTGSSGLYGCHSDRSPTGDQSHHDLPNHGPLAGTRSSIPTRDLATPIVPPHVQDPMDSARAYFNSEGRCVFCDILAEELDQGLRVIEETEHFLCFASFAARSPFETRIYPKRHGGSICGTTQEERADLGGLLRRTLGRIHGALGNPDYNWIVRSAPIGDEDVRYYHWYMVIVPKVTTPAGFEMGTGIYINTSVPEEAAICLRETEPVAVRET